MVSINKSGFASKIEEYCRDPNKPENWFLEVTARPDADTVYSTLCVPTGKVAPESSTFFPRLEMHGIAFGYNTELVMKLINRAYNNLSEDCDLTDYSKAVAESMQGFAEPFPDGEETLCYPHFLLHGLVQPTLEQVLNKIDSNSRIIHETRKDKDKIMKKYGRVGINGGLQLTMANGATDDYFGIAHLLAKDDEKYPSSSCGYVAKASFFVDQTNNEIYVMTVQGRRYESLGPSSVNTTERTKLGEKEFARIGNILGRSPRRFILTKVMDFGRDNGFDRIKVIKPEEHPMFIESHKGFLANYDSVIIKAGVTEENGCYLENKL